MDSSYNEIGTKILLERSLDMESFDAFKINSSTHETSALPENPVVAMAYIPYQNPQEVYSVEEGINTGTMFPCLDKPFIGCRGENK